MKKLKRASSIIIIMAMLASVLSLTSFAASESGFIYTVSNRQAQVTGYKGAGGTVTIPSKLGGYPVTSIGDKAFRFNLDLTSISIPKGVKSIGGGAFLDCEYLTVISIPQGVISIGGGAFLGTGLINIIIPSTVTNIGSVCFAENTKLKSIRFDSASTQIEYLHYKDDGMGEFATGKMTIIGYDPSTAKDYAKQFNAQFVVISAGKIAIPTQSDVLVNGGRVAFQAYTVDGNNYFKLRDLAMALSGSAKQFQVGWDGTNNAISLTSGNAYTPVGGELTVPSSGSESVSATLSSSKVYLNGAQVNLTVYTIGSNNYFKLRDIASTINFGVTWNGGTNTIGIDTTAGYTA